MQHDPMVFDLEPVEIPVTIRGKKEKLVLHEAPAEAGRKYNSARLASIVYEDGKVAGHRNSGDVELLLVGECLCYSDDGIHARRDANDKLQCVGMEYVRHVLYSIVSQLYDVALKISKLRDSQVTLEGVERQIKELQIVRHKLLEDERKKLQSSGTNGSASQHDSESPSTSSAVGEGR